MCNYATKADSKNSTGVDESKFAKKADLANLKSDVDKLDIDQLKNEPSNSSNLKSNVVRCWWISICSCWFKLTKWCSRKLCC